MRTLNTLLTASILALGACQEPTPICDEDCEGVVAWVAAQANTALSNNDKLHREAVPLSKIKASCKARVSKSVTDCMVADESSEFARPGDVCLNIAAEELKQCARK